MSGALAAGAYGAWRWDAPEGVSIVSGSVKLSYKTSADTSVYMKAILRSEVFHTQPHVHTATTDGSATWTVPSDPLRAAIRRQSTACPKACRTSGSLNGAFVVSKP